MSPKSAPGGQTLGSNRFPGAPQGLPEPSQGLPEPPQVQVDTVRLKMGGPRKAPRRPDGSPRALPRPSRAFWGLPAYQSPGPHHPTFQPQSISSTGPAEFQLRSPSLPLPRPRPLPLPAPSAQRASSLGSFGLLGAWAWVRSRGGCVVAFWDFPRWWSRWEAFPKQNVTVTF